MKIRKQGTNVVHWLIQLALIRLFLGCRTQVCGGSRGKVCGFTLWGDWSSGLGSRNEEVEGRPTVSKMTT